MKKATYHSNSSYNVCAKIVSNDVEYCNKYISIKGKNL